MAGSFSDLDMKCSNSIDGEEYLNAENTLILKHINGKITKSHWFVKYNDYLYMYANTFTDNYRYLGGYLLRYDCRDKITKIISPLIKKNFPGESGFISFDNSVGTILIQSLGSENYRAAWIYDLTTEKLKPINSAKFKAPRNQKVSWQVKLGSYDGYSIDIELLYYKKIASWNGYSYKYENYGNPDIIQYNF